MTREDNIKLVEDHIQLRLDPKIYAFSTNTIPNYLKVGDTLRPVDVRISEWEKLIAERLGQKPVITKEGDFSALLSQDHYFRDYSVHSYLETVGKHRLDGELAHKYSIEFFENTDINDVERAINDIQQDYLSEELSKKYSYYCVSDSTHAEAHGTNDKEWHLRPNQQEVVDNFSNRPNEKKLLMYAVMRFGKSFTAMYCALAKNAKKVLIVSAKADVKGEWQKTIETPTCFKDYKFICDSDLKNNFDIANYLSENASNKVAVFLTLQNLCGKDSDGNNIKKRLELIYNTEYDLLIVDETHYGAWAHEYGKPIKDADEDVIAEERKDFDKFKNKVQTIKATQQLHLSGTPYNLLYEEKFTEDNIVAMCQYKDILAAKKSWDEEHFADIENDKLNPETGYKYQESDNPYFGFPQMLRFAFNLPYSIREELRQSKSNGSQWTLNDLFGTRIQDGEVKFKHEAAVLCLLKAIDGSEENDDIFGFLNVPKIRDNYVCKHMVFALPFKYSCDAMELLLNKYKLQFLNLGNYEALNITGHNLKSELDTVDKVKAHISQCEKNNKKTITLTVYKMLTGVTVKEWDTMIMLKNTQSPQEYDQAVFRIQNQFVQEYVADNGSKFKKDLKPQTILVDFDPVRMFNIQGLSTRVVNKVKGNVQSLEETIADDLHFSPIIAYNAKNLVKVEPKNLIELILKYNSDKSIIDDVKSVAWNSALLSNSDLAAYIRSQNPNGLNNKSTQTEAHASENQSEFNNPDGDASDNGNVNSENPENTQTDGFANADKNADGEDKDIAKKYRMCIAKLAFFAFLSKSDIDSLQAILNSLEPNDKYSSDNNRIFENLELDKKFIQGLINFMTRTDALEADEVIKRANMLSKDEDLEESERALNALNRFSRFSNSEIVTPNNIATDMCNLIGKDKLIEIVNRGEKILDIASKSGEFAYALYTILKGNVEDEKLNNAIYSIPTSTTAYEFTRRIYEALGLNAECIAYGSRNIDEAITSYDLLKIKKKDELDYEQIISILTQDKPFYSIKRTDAITQGDRKVKFGAIVGNPPYQEESNSESASNGQKPRTNIFHLFQILAQKLSNDKTVLILPGKRWLHQSGKGVKDFGKDLINSVQLEKIIFYANSKDVFINSDISDGVSIVVTDKAKTASGFDFVCIENGKPVELHQNNPGDKLIILNPQDAIIANKIANVVKSNNFKYLFGSVLPRSLFGIESDFIEKNRNKVKVFNNGDILNTNEIKLLTNDKAGPAGRSCWFIIDKNEIKQNDSYINEWQVVVSSAHPGGQEGRDNQAAIIDNKSAFGRSRVALKSFKTQQEAENFFKYISCHFIKYTFLLSDEALSSLARFVPDIGDYSNDHWFIDFTKSIAEIDKQLYAKFGLTDEEIAFIESMIKPME